MALRQVASRNRLNMPAPLALLAFILAVAIAAVPVFSHAFVSMNDVYNHVARAPVLAHYDSVAAYRTYWIPNWRLVPYVGFDLVSVALLPWFSLGAIVKLMVAATMASMLAGAMLLARAAHGRWSGAALTCALLLMNRTLLAGFINYLFGIGVSLMGAAAWIALRERGAVARVVVLAIFATALAAIHLFACGVLGVIVVGIELAIFTERRGGFGQLLRAVVLPAIAFIPAFLLVIFVAPHPAFHIVYKGIGSRLAAFAVPLTYAPIEEAVGFLLVGVVIAVLWGLGRVRIDRRLAAAAALLAVIQMMMPSEIGAATVVDHRIPIAFWLVALCAIELRLERTAVAAGFVMLLAAVLVSRVAVVQSRWTKDNVVYADADQAMASLPGSARVATAYPMTALDTATRPDVSLYYMPALEFVPRGGFTQILWTIPDQHPLMMQPAFRQLAEQASPETLWRVFVTGGGQGEDAVLDSKALAAIKDYDYLVFLYAQPFDVKPMNLLEPVHDAPGIRIYRVRHDAGGERGAASEAAGTAPR